jgi:hypothetical protein
MLMLPGTSVRGTDSVHLTRPLPLWHTTRSGRVIDTVTMLDADVGLVAIPDPRGGRRYVGDPIPRGSRFSISVDGRWVAVVRTEVSGPDAFSYEVRLLEAPAGSVSYVRHVPLERAPNATRVVDSIIESLAARLRGVRDSTAAVRQALVIPPTATPVVSVLVDRDGSVWLRSPDGVWTIHDPRGSPIAIFREPPRTRFVSLDDGVWAIERDEVDVQSVVRYRVR